MLVSYTVVVIGKNPIIQLTKELMLFLVMSSRVSSIMNFYCTKNRLKSDWSYSALVATCKLKPVSWSPGFSNWPLTISFNLLSQVSFK